ncbi:MAG: pilus assembly protein PilZ [Treponema sp.]|nr:pilus assembly protein PilZ [Treponema sp.]
MSNLTSQQLNAFYEQYKTSFVTFSKEAIKATGLCAQRIYLKCMGDFWPCVLYSSSFETVKVVVNIKAGLVERLQSAKNTASLRFCFRTSENSEALIFFVNMKSLGFAPYGSSDDVAIFTFQYIQRPPDDLIEILGRFLSVNENFSKRRSERITLTPDTIRKLNIAKEAVILIKGVSRNCLIRDISFFGAKVIVRGPSKSIEIESAALNIAFNNPNETFMIPSYLIRVEMVEGRQDLLALGVAFNEDTIPINYKMRISDYFNQMRQEHISDTLKSLEPMRESSSPRRVKGSLSDALDSFSDALKGLSPMR